jgi:hypothetical protein
MRTAAASAREATYYAVPHQLPMIHAIVPPGKLKRLKEAMLVSRNELIWS